MANPITFTVFNNSNTVATVDSMAFTTDANVRHATTLTNFGQIGVFTGSNVTLNTSMPGNSDLSFMSHYTTATSVLGDYTSTIVISYTLNSLSAENTITNTVTLSTNPLPDPANRVVVGGGTGGSSGGGGGGWDIIPILIGIAILSECFTPGTQVLMADGTTKNIEDVVIGDQVYNHDRSAINTVKFLENAVDSIWLELYTPSTDFEPFATVNHPLYINGSLSSVYPDQHFESYPWLGQTTKVTPSKIVPAQGRTVYNLWVDGDHTYVVNGYGTPSIIDDGAFLRQAAEYNYITFDQTMKILHDHSNNGRALRVGSYHVNEFLGWLDLRPLTKVIARSLSGPTTIFKQSLHLIMRAVGVVANLIYKTRN